MGCLGKRTCLGNFQQRCLHGRPSSECIQVLGVTPGFEGKPNVNHVRARFRTHVHGAYIIGHHHTMLKVNSGKVL
jgi:hypothetical protein